MIDQLLRIVNGLGTKFVLSIFALTGAFIGLSWGWLSGGEFVASVNITIGAYVIGNFANNREVLRAEAPAEPKP